MPSDSVIKPIDDNTEKNSIKPLEWKSRMEHILFFLLYVTDYGTIILISDFSLLPYLIMTVLVGYPIIFFQNFIGQFTRKGCIFLKEMIPMLSGVGYSMFLLSSFTFLNQIFNTSTLIYYFLVALFNSSPPWMKCFPSFYKLYPNCFSKTDFDLCPTKKISSEPCFPLNSRILSSYIFKKVVVFGRLNNNNETSDILYSKQEKYGLNLLTKSLVLIPLIGTAHINMKALALSLHLAIALCAAALLIMTVLVLSAPGTHSGFIWWYEAINFENIFTFRLWLLYFQDTIEKLKLADGFHILFGSFIPQSNPDKWRCLYLMLSYIVIAILSSLYYTFFVEVINYRLNIELEAYQSTDEDAIFIIIPTFLGIQASSYSFSVIVFLMFTTVSFHSLLIKLIVLEKTITVQLNIPEYSYYVRLGICLVAIVVSSLLSVLDGKFIVTEFQKFLTFYKPISIGLLMIILWMYGVQKLCDDVEYLLGTKTKGFVKLGWLLTPVLCSISSVINILNYEMSPFSLILIVIMSGIYIVSLVLKTISLAKNKNIMELFKATDEFGSPDINDRIQRILHNPSFEVKFRRQQEVCNHDCLLNRTSVDTALKEELELLSKFTEELRSGKSARVLGEKFILHIEKHKKHLLNLINEKQQKRKLKMEGSAEYNI